MFRKGVQCASKVLNTGALYECDGGKELFPLLSYKLAAQKVPQTFIISRLHDQHRHTCSFLNLRLHPVAALIARYVL